MPEKIVISSTDIFIIISYLLLLICLGIYYTKFKQFKTADDLFLGGRTLNWYRIGLSLFSTNVSPMMIVGFCGIAFSSGMAVANFEWLAWLFLMLLAMVFIPHYLSTRVSTMPEFLQKRYGKNSHTFLSYYSLFSTLVVWVSFVLFTGGIVISQALNIHLWIAIIGVAIFAASYTVAGGLNAVVRIGVLQSVVVTIATISISVIAINRIGGISKVISSAPIEYWTIFRPSSDNVYPWHAILLGYPVIGIWYWCTDQTIVQRVLAAKNIEQGQYGIILLSLLKALIPFIFLIPGIYCFILYPNISSSDHAYVTLVAKLLPLGFVGLTLAALVGALINDVAVGLNAFSTVFTLDIYVKKINPNATQQKIKKVGRIMIIATAFVGVFIALILSQLNKGLFDLSQAVGTYLAPPLSTVFLLGILWKGATSKAANTILFLGSPICLVIGFMQLTDYPYKGYWPHFMLLSFYLMSGLMLLMIAISLITKPNNSSSFQTLAQTYSNQPKFNKSKVWLGWLVIAFIMLTIYYIFK